MAELAGMLVGNYFLLECLAHEGMVETYRARPTTQGGYDVILRLFRPSFPDTTSFRDHFPDEVEKVWRCHHEHIQPLLEFGTGDDLLYTATRLSDARTLEELLDHQPGQHLPLPFVIRCITQLCDALQYVHEHDIVHGNIQPSSILQRDSEHILLTNFGLKRAYQGDMLPASHIDEGNPAYCAPEQSLGMICPASDIYAVGVLLYRLLTGVLPYDGETPEEIALNHADEFIPSVRAIRPEIPEAIDRVVQTALAKNAEMRFESADALTQALQSAILAGSNTQIISASGPHRRIIVRSRHTSFSWSWSRAMSWITTLLLVCGLVGTSFFVFSLPQLGGHPFWSTSQPYSPVGTAGSSTPTIPSRQNTPLKTPAPLSTPNGSTQPTQPQNPSSTATAGTRGTATGTTTNTPTPAPTLAPSTSSLCISGNISMDVSPTIAPLLQHINSDYVAQCPSVTFSFHMNESRTVLNAIQHNQVNIAVCDVAARSNRHLVDHPFVAVMYALVASPDVQVSSLSLSQIQGIYQGQITNWSQVGGPDEAITVLLHPPTDATSAIFRAFVLNGVSEHVQGIKVKNNWAQAVAQAKGAISYAPLVEVQNTSVSVLAINGVLPGSQALLQNTYPFWNVEHLYTQDTNTSQFDSYLVFLNTTSELAIMSQLGTIPVSMIPEQILATHLSGSEI